MQELYNIRIFFTVSLIIIYIHGKFLAYYNYYRFFVTSQDLQYAT